jgi:uncharacterized membrane protein
MTKKEFLKILENELQSRNYPEIKSLLDFYEELIEDKIESGMKEKEVISEIGNVQTIIKNISADQKVIEAKRKPTLSNGLKALFAVLGIFSLPLLIPLGIVMLSLVIALIAILIALIIVFAAGILSGGALLVILFAQLIHYDLPFASFLLGIGVSLIITGGFVELFRLSIILPKKLIILIIKQLEKIMNRRKGVDRYE